MHSRFNRQYTFAETQEMQKIKDEGKPIETSDERRQIWASKYSMSKEAYRDKIRALDEKEGTYAIDIYRRDKNWADDDHYDTLSPEEKAEIEHVKIHGRVSFSDKVLNFGMSDKTWNKDLGDRYGILRLGIWSTIALTGLGFGISRYKKNQIETLVADANKSKAKKNE